MTESQETCCRCYNSKFLQPDLRLLVGPCLHKLCESCVKICFAYGNAPCPRCGNSLRKADFLEQTFDDLLVEKEVRIRKQLSHLFCKREEDFPTLRDFNDYLEEIEEIVFKMVNEVDVEATKQAIEVFRQENRELIARNRQKQRSEDNFITQLLERDAEDRRRRMEQDRIEQQEERKLRKKEEQEFLDALANGDQSATKLISKKQKTRKAAMTKNSQEINSDTSAFRSYFDILKKSEMSSFPEAMETDPTELAEFDPLEGVQDWIFDPETLEGFIDPIFNQMPAEEKNRRTAGGYSLQLHFSRALESATTSLLSVPPIKLDQVTKMHMDPLEM